MAFGFIKKVFSFGKKEVRETPPEAEAAVTPSLEQPQPETEAPATPSPSKEGVIDAVGRDEVAGSSDATEVNAVAEAPVVAEAPAAVEETPSGPSDHLPLDGAEEVEPVSPSPEPEFVPEEPAPAPTPVEPEPVEPAPSEPEIPVTPGEVPTEPEETPVAPPAEIPVPAPPQEVPAEPVEVPEPPQETAPMSPSPLRQEPVEAIDRDGLAGSPDAADANATAEAPVVAEAPVAPEMPAGEEKAPSDPSDHLALKREEEVVTPAPPAPGKVTVSKKVEQKAEPVAPQAAPEPRPSWFQRLRQGLSRSSKELSGSIAGVFTKRKLDEDTLEELEDVLIRADLGMETAIRITDTLSASRYGKDVSDTEVRAIMATEVEKVLTPVAMPLELDLSHKPHVILVVGVNGTGKTTTIGKLAAKLTEGGLSVMLAAGDTFRAAAIEQLRIWGERTGSPVVSSKLGADAAGLAYDAFEKAKAAGSDVLIIDTAGRLQNKAELMAELEKIVRVLGKLDPEAPHTVLQTVDATTGQNALNQVEIFRNVAGVNGLVMTKLDGTARGGILVAIAAKYRLPVYFIGVGEQVDDLEPFSAGDFAKAIAGVA
ncbi:signal recognition particle-docking protein FtsY [Pseudaminobacter salicylatoxidans]|uniref:signal recognition particle-docking protein FtsY n=1 Tax=Pseudaminobacter salicylatoxidans TaxID=93369 RepID=UPI0003179976|nr:signal recognition particle-docking protein FtsY [Pseudaminobacter salicylatoxidans]